jgi:hypothetical protein
MKIQLYHSRNPSLLVTTSTMRPKVDLSLKVYEPVLPCSKHNIGCMLERAQSERAAGRWKSTHQAQHAYELMKWMKYVQD